MSQRRRRSRGTVEGMRAAGDLGGMTADLLGLGDLGCLVGSGGFGHGPNGRLCIMSPGLYLT